MDSAFSTSSEIADLSSQDAQTVCEALGRYEETLQGAVREIHVDIQIFKRGVERQLEDVLRLAGPLPRTVCELQQENASLRAQVQRLAQQVERLARSAGLHDNWAAQENSMTPCTTGGPESPRTPVGTLPGSPSTPGGTLPGSPCTPGGPLPGFPAPSGSLPSSPSHHGTRFSSHAQLCVSGTAQSLEQDVQNEMENSRISNPSIIANGHQPVTGQLKMTHEGAASAQTASLSSQQHSPPTSLRMPHLPVTAVTRVSEKFSGEAATSYSTKSSSGHLEQNSRSQSEAAIKTSSLSANAVRTWSAGSMRTMGVSATSENSTSISSVTKSMSTKSYGMTSGTKSSESAVDSYFDVTPKSRSPPPAIHRQVEKRRELVRSQTLPRTSGTQARKAFFEKFDTEVGKVKGDSKVKLKRSQSFGVASASSIKQVLLEWCKSKTIGYKKIDLQNFSSSWNDGMAFCALVHSFFPEAFDYDALIPTNHKENFELAFSMAEKLAHCDRLIEVEDMLMMGRKPDPMCVFTYVQSLYNHLRRFE
ncbi:smoothelin-like protein 2 [Ambystoma mexicanum]|uniref:smoothelin-like protein 2 n=1 Tax=Ambystoma mexicanum TaxID=8296 RepID=UPI0037E8F59B